MPDSNRHLTCDKKGIFKLQDALPFTPTASMYMDKSETLLHNQTATFSRVLTSTILRSDAVHLIT